MMKTVIITGANGNLGTAVTKVFLEKGYRVVATVLTEAMKNDLPPHDLLEPVVVDLGNETATASFVRSVIDKHGAVAAGILLVGGFRMGGIDTTTSSQVEQQIALNFTTAYHVARPLFQHMMSEKSGRLIFIGARPAIEPMQGKNLVAYGLSKSMLFTLAEFLNAEAKGTNVTATVVAPSTLDTPLNRKSMPDTDPGIWVNPVTLAEILAFVVSDQGTPLRETVLKVYNNA